MEPFDATPWATPAIQTLKAYTPGEQPDSADWIKLNTNESPYPPSPLVDAAILAALPRLRKYPNPRSASLRSAIARLYQLDPQQVIVGNGSDDLLNLLIRAFASEVPAGMLNPSYSLYPVLCACVGKEIVQVPFNGDMTFDLERVTASDSRLFFITSPNAPTGVAIPNTTLGKILEEFEGLVVVDEAYADFAEENALNLLKSYPNCVITRTFSKSYGLAGLRVGFALAHPSVIGVLDKIRDSYNVDLLAQAGAEAAIEDQGYFKAIIGKVIRNRAYLTQECRRRGWFTYNSQANFIFTRPEKNGCSGPAIASDLLAFLKTHKILVRHFPGNPAIAPFLRISIGDEDELLSLLETIDLWLNRAPSN